MADDISVRITADIANFVQALNTATSKIEASTKEMSTNLEKVADSSKKTTEGFLGMGEAFNSVKSLAAGFSVGALLTKGVEGAVNLIKEIPAAISEAIAKTNELAEAYKVLGYVTGASTAEMDKFVATTELSGDSIDDLQGLMVGMQRGIKANAEALIANGVASSKAALMGMSFEDYLLKVNSILEEMQNPTDREQMLIAAFGKSGVLAGAQLKEFADNLKTAKDLVQDGLLPEDARTKLEEHEQAVGRLTIALQRAQAAQSSHWQDWINGWKNIRAEMLNTGSDAATYQRYMEAGIISYKEVLNKTVPEIMAKIRKIRGEWDAVAASSMDAGARAGGYLAGREWPKTFVNPSDKPKPKPPKSPKPEEPYVDNEALSILEVNEWCEKYLAAKTAAYDKDAKAAKAYADKIAKEKAEYLAKELEDQENAAREAAAAAQIAWEQTTAKGGIYAYLREAKQALREWGSWTKALSQSVENSLTASFQSMLTYGKITSDGLRNLFSNLYQAFAGMVAQMLAKWVTAKLAELILGKTTAASEAASMSGAYAVAAMQSVAAIPVVGWAMAPGVGAAAYALGLTYAGLASAAGGWDRVPADQLAMIHKNEMVLPASLAEGARETFAKGGGGAVHIHVSTVDASGFEKMLTRNQGSLLKVLREARLCARTS